MDSQIPAVYSLPPELAHHVFRHLSKRDKQQFALCCKHTYLCALAAVKSIVLSHKCLAQGKSMKLKTVRSSCFLRFFEVGFSLAACLLCCWAHLLCWHQTLDHSSMASTAPSATYTEVFS